MTEDQVEEIKQKIDIVDLVGSYIELKKAGVNYKAVCPFHPDNDPSLMVSPERQSFKCFGCDKGGDIFTFVQEIEGVDFPEALRILADRAGVKLQRVSREFYDQKKEFIEINESAAEVYNFLLTKNKIGKKALEYLKKRKISDQMIEDFQIGYAANNWQMVTRYLKKKGYKEKDLLSLGIAVPGRRGAYDRFRGRIMFPINDATGRTVGFSGRLLEWNKNMPVGKYINSPESPVFSKSKLLFGYDKAKSEIRKKKFAIFVEGQIDVILSHGAGFKNTVASLGTAVTETQLETLHRLTDKLYFALDQDAAGIRATKKSIDLALSLGFYVKVIVLPKNFKDAAEAIEKDKRIWAKAVAEAQEIMDFYFNLAFRGRDKNEFTPENKKKIASFLLPEISRFANPVLKGEYIARLSEKLHIEEKYLFEALTKSPGEKEISAPDSSAPEDVRRNFEARLLSIILKFPNHLPEIRKSLKEREFSEEISRAIYKKVLTFYNKEGKTKSEKKINLLPSEEKFIEVETFSVEKDYAEVDEKILLSEISELVARIREGSLRRERGDFFGRIKAAEKSGDKAQVLDLIRDLQEKIIEKNKE